VPSHAVAKNQRSGFRQKAALFNLLEFAALCRDAATVKWYFPEVSIRFY
jgi:hypothetical protein